MARTKTLNLPLVLTSSWSRMYEPARQIVRLRKSGRKNITSTVRKV
jgi:hypothetical protein